MTLLAQLAVAAGVAAAPAPRAVPPDSARPPAVADRWLGADKAKHFFVAGLVESAAFAAARGAGVERRPALAVALGVAGAVSVGKELADRRGRGSPSVRDLVWDAAGIALYGAALARTRP